MLWQYKENMEQFTVNATSGPEDKSFNRYAKSNMDYAYKWELRMADWASVTDKIKTK